MTRSCSARSRTVEPTTGLNLNYFFHICLLHRSGCVSHLIVMHGVAATLSVEVRALSCPPVLHPSSNDDERRRSFDGHRFLRWGSMDVRRQPSDTSHGVLAYRSCALSTFSLCDSPTSSNLQSDASGCMQNRFTVQLTPTASKLHCPRIQSPSHT